MAPAAPAGLRRACLRRRLRAAGVPHAAGDLRRRICGGRSLAAAPAAARMAARVAVATVVATVVLVMMVNNRVVRKARDEQQQQ